MSFTVAGFPLKLLGLSSCDLVTSREGGAGGKITENIRPLEDFQKNIALQEIVKNSPEWFSSETGYAPSKEVCLELFQLDQQPIYTRSIDFWDLLPKFFYLADKKARAQENDVAQMEILIDKKAYTIARSPGRIYKKNAAGKVVVIVRWAGEREELISRALRWLSTQNQIPLSVWRDAEEAKQIRTIFPVGAIAGILAEWKHPFSPTQIDEGLQILADSTIVIFEQGNENPSFTGHLLASVFSIDRKRVVTFNEIESEGICDGAFRVLRNDVLVSIKDPLARRLFELLMLRHRNACKPSDEDGAPVPPPYTLNCLTLIKEGVLSKNAEMSKTVAKLRSKLQILGEHGVLWQKQPFRERQITLSTGGRRRVINAEFEVWLSKPSVEQMIASHKEAMSYSKGDPIISNLSDSYKERSRREAKKDLPSR